MKCTNCGAEMAPGTAFCGSCGTPAAVQEQPQVPVQPEPQPQYQAPVYQAPAQTQVLANKKDYMATLASDKVKRNRKLAPILALVCALVLVVSYFAAMNTSILDLPIMTWAMPEDERDSMKDDMDDVLDQMDDAEERLDELDGKYTNDQIEAVEDCLNATRDAAENTSVSNVQRMLETVKKASDENIDEFTDLEDDLEETAEVVDIVSGVLLGGLIFVLFFTVLGGLCKSRGLVLWGMILSVFYTLPLSGVIFTVLSVAAHVVVFSMLASGDKEYRAYRKANRTH